MRMASLILTLVGPDRPGLVRILAEEVAARDGSWLESRMARLAGQFAGIVLVNLPETEIGALTAILHDLEDEGLRVVVQQGVPDRAPALDRIFHVEVVGQDRPGIIRDITQALWDRGVNIEELTTNVLSGSFSGEMMFRIDARLRVPATTSVDDIRDDLEDLGNDLMVDIRSTGALADA
jgi:glycine cleavage system regulatory protein